LPRSGFKSITISEDIYEILFDTYKKDKKEYAMNGINSFSGYIIYHLKSAGKTVCSNCGGHLK